MLYPRGVIAGQKLRAHSTARKGIEMDRLNKGM